MSRSPARVAVPAILWTLAVAVPPAAAARTLAAEHLVASVTLGFWVFKAVAAGLGFWWWSAHRVLGAGEGRFAPPEEVGPADWLLAFGIMTLALVLRLIGLGEGLWYDEIDTVTSYLHRPIGELTTLFDSQNHHVLYTLAARVSTLLFGLEAWSVRLPAVVFGVLSVGAVWWFGALVAARREAILASLMLALSYHHVWFSQNARGYTGLLLSTLVATGCLVRLVRGPDRPAPWVAAYAIVAGLGTYIHATAVLVVVMHTVVALLAWVAVRARVSRDRVLAVAWALIGAGGVSALVYAPVLPQFFDTLLAPTMEGIDIAWKNPVWLLMETVRGLARGIPGGMVSVALGVGVTLAGLVSYLRRDPLVAALMLGPGLLMAAVALALGHNLWPRLFFFSAGFAVLIVFRGVRVITAPLGAVSSPVALTLSGLLVLGSAVTLPTAWNPKQDYRAARDYVVREAPPDAVAVVDMTKMPYLEYYGLDWAAVDNGEDLARFEGGRPETWVLYTFPTRLEAVFPGVWARLQSDYEVAAEFPGTVQGGTIVVMVRRNAG